MSMNIESNRSQPERASSRSRPMARQDLLALYSGIAVSILFTGLIWWLSPHLESFRATLLPDSGPSWYYWRLPVENWGAKLSAWGFYLIHQLAIWGLIYLAQQQKPRYGSSLHWFNYAALGINALFGFVHLAQTHIWYDGLAQDVSIWSSQWSVIIMLVLIVLMENQRRGLFFGYRAPLSKRAVGFVRHYHGYIFAWAIIYTYWYHPTETTNGHLLGFFYTFLLMLQGSLFFTRIHLNRWWTVSLELLVLIHGVVVAISQPSNMWPMFGFGFAGVLVVTQMHGLGLSRRLRLGLLALYIGSALAVYYDRGLDKLYQISFIPVTYYVTVVAFALLIGALAWVYDRVSNRGGQQVKEVGS
jgi:hypothetical protein